MTYILVKNGLSVSIISMEEIMLAKKLHFLSLSLDPHDYFRICFLPLGDQGVHILEYL